MLYYRGWIMSMLNKKKAWNIYFIICHEHQTKSGKIKANKTQQIWVTTQVFFCKNWTTTYSTTAQIINPWKNRIRIFLTWNWQLIRDWPEIKQENMIHAYDVIIMTSQGCYNFQLFHLGKITRNYYTPVTCYM